MAEKNDVRLRGTVPDMKHQDMDAFWHECAEIKQQKGVLGLEAVVPNVDDDFIKTGLMLMIDGAEEEIVTNVLEGMLANSLRDIENKYRKSLYAILYLRQSANPKVMNELMRSYK